MDLSGHKLEMTLMEKVVVDDRSGRSVALSTDGSVLAVGAMNHDGVNSSP